MAKNIVKWYMVGLEINLVVDETYEAKWNLTDLLPEGCEAEKLLNSDDVFKEVLFYGFKQKTGDAAAMVSLAVEKFENIKAAGDRLTSRGEGRLFNAKNNGTGNSGTSKRLLEVLSNCKLSFRNHFMNQGRFDLLAKLDFLKLDKMIEQFVMEALKSTPVKDITKGVEAEIIKVLVETSEEEILAKAGK